MENKEITNLIKKFKKYARKKEFILNPDKSIVKMNIKGMLKNKKKFGELYCPCRLVSKNKEKDKQIICPCIFHKKEIKSQGHCHCSLFVQKNKESKGEIKMPWVDEDMCVGCGICVEECPVNAISMKNGKAIIDMKKCIRCKKCHEICPQKAIKHDKEKGGIKMKIAISSTGKNLESEVDAKFGRCNYFLIVEIEKNKIKDFKAIENTAKAQMGGAGISAGEIVANEKPDAVITTNLGPRAFSVFKQFKIKVYSEQGKIKDVVQNFIEGKSKEMTDATGPQHVGLK